MRGMIKAVFATGLAGAVAALSGCVLDPVYGGGRPGGHPTYPDYPPAQGGYHPPGQNYPSPGHSYDRQFRCESIDNRQRYCSADTRGGVQLVRQLSKSPCVRGRTWGYDRNGVWVSNGCRAEFRSGGGGYGGQDPGYGGQVVRCESVDARYRHCNVPVRRGVELTRQLSKARCVEGRNWGWDRRGIWVNYGCRAEFRVY
ncbi:hypothetical protein GCM10027084_15240 [Pseudoxanthomonas sangjuensis]|uniref:DUF3011 domain-containing protein n=1 Tax=Pseudoxanthomonas sangjuensis TaxID=1503750 RepID=UPI001390C960|nr:DUF3011 domain-containing protein [Pseudoxanthomonas sangjuensis]KAF1715816.1 hypothetical protein CSC71_00810 [Pseudoxanthomonas sangjuensis]